MKLKLSKSAILLLIFLIYFDNCGHSKSQFDSIFPSQKKYVLLIHFEGNNCINCLSPLKLLREFIPRFNNVTILFTGKDTQSFWFIFNNLNLEAEYLSFSDFNKLNLPKKNITPFVYLINIEKNQIIFMDKLPKHENKFHYLLNFIHNYIDN